MSSPWELEGGAPQGKVGEDPSTLLEGENQAKYLTKMLDLVQF